VFSPFSLIRILGSSFYNGKQIMPSRRHIDSSRASYWHLPITPFHGGLQKVKGKVDGFP
jgi:hypothetical protein